MTEEQSAKLSEALSLGYTIYIDGKGYVTGPVTSIDLLEFPNEEGDQGWVYTDDTYNEMPLSGVELDEVKCFQRIDFLNLELEQQLEDHEFTYNPDLVPYMGEPELFADKKDWEDNGDPDEDILQVLRDIEDDEDDADYDADSGINGEPGYDDKEV